MKNRPLSADTCWRLCPDLSSAPPDEIPMQLNETHRVSITARKGKVRCHEESSFGPMSTVRIRSRKYV